MCTTLSPEAQKILELIEASPYQGEGEFHLACGFRDFKGYGHENSEYESLVLPYIDELKAAGLIYRSSCTTYGRQWVATRYRSLNDDFDRFSSNGKARSLLLALKIKTIEELTTFTAKDLMAVRNCGRKTVCLIEEALKKRGLSLSAAVLTSANQKPAYLPDTDVLFIVRRKINHSETTTYSWAYYYENEIEEVIRKHVESATKQAGLPFE